MWETRVRSLGREDPLEKEMATHSSTLAWKILWTEEPGGLQSTESQRVGHTERLYFLSLSFEAAGKYEVLKCYNTVSMFIFLEVANIEFFILKAIAKKKNKINKIK